MGFYINPEEETKEQWLEKHAEQLSWQMHESLWQMLRDDEVPIVLLDNGAFTAAGIAYCEQELKEFCDPHDTRPRTLYLTKKAEVVALHPWMSDIFEQ